MSALDDRLQAFAGKQAGPPFTARDAVSEAMIRHWCEAMGNANPRYAGRDAVAPAEMLQAWTMKGLTQPPADPNDAQKQLIAVLDEAGFTSIVATNSEQEYVRYLRPGDVITAATVVESVSGEKATALGRGHFFTTLTTYTDQSGERVGTLRMRLLKFAPASAGAKPRPAVNDDNAFFWDGAGKNELRIQRCVSCSTLRHPPRPMCGACGSLDWDTVVSSGLGTLYSFAVHHYPDVPGFGVPFVVGLVELEEGTRVVTNLLVAPGDARIGMPVEVAFEKRDENLSVPVFRPRSTS